MRIAVDATAAAVQSAGVGRYTRELLRALLLLPDDDRYLLLSASSTAEAQQLLRSLPPGAWRELRRLPASERLMTALWQRLRIPLPVELVAGHFDVFHGPDFVVPPSRGPSVVTIHDLSYIVAPQYAEPSLVAYLRSAVPRSLKRASQIITVSASVAADLVEAYPFAEGRIRAIPNGVRPLIADRNRSAPNGPPSILIVGTIEPRKNLVTLLDAMQYVWHEIPDAQLVVAGRIGWRSEEILRKLREACLTSRVTFVESPPDTQLELLFEEASLFVYPSAHEGFGLPLLEAMSRDVPVIASDIPALRETADAAACFVNAFDSEALGNEIVRLLADPELCADLVQAGRQRVAKHSWAETARRTRNAYQAAANGKT
ncbi:MAG: glycosyltransferase family 4 protein [Chloroflexia bacterium]|nr:glycosyltransferase family 4 protein [Chloroflexia bacterium]